MLQLRGLRHDARFSCGPEYLLKVQVLPLVGDIEYLVRMPVLHPLDQGGQIRGGVDGGAVGLDENAGRHFLLVSLQGHGDDPGSFGLDGNAPGLHVLHHGGDIGVRVAFTQPLLKVDIQVVIILFEVCHRHVHNVLPQGPVAPAALLQLQGSLVGLVGEFRVCLFGRGGGVDLLQIRNGEGGFLGVLALKIGVKVGQIRLPLT